MIVAAKIMCNVIVVLIYGEELYTIGEVEVVGQDSIRLINGIDYRCEIKKLIQKCTSERLREYLYRIGDKNYYLKEAEKREFIELACQIKNFENIRFSTSPINYIYSEDKN